MKASISSGLLLILPFFVLPHFVLKLSALPAGAWVAESWVSKSNEVRATIVYDDVVTDVSSARVEAGQLWISTADLKRATRFEVKPQGVCRDELCFPLPKARQQEFLHKDAGPARSNVNWFNLTAFAGLVHQPVAHDEALATWYFGLRSDQRQVLSSLQAPGFTLPDLHGKPHRLSDFRGKKVLLVTWASW